MTKNSNKRSGYEYIKCYLSFGIECKYFSSYWLVMIAVSYESNGFSHMVKAGKIWLELLLSCYLTGWKTPQNGRFGSLTMATRCKNLEQKSGSWQNEVKQYRISHS